MRTTLTAILMPLFWVALLVHKESSAQQQVLDGAYIEEHTPTRKVVQPPHLREADVMYEKRIWRQIDLKQKMNQPLFYPQKEIEDRQSLWQVLKEGITVDGSITAYDPGPVNQDDEFTSPLLPSEAEAEMVDTTTITKYDAQGNPYDTNVTEEITGGDIKRYRIKEDWFFDKQRSVMEQRIIGLAPMVELTSESGEHQGYAPLFWIYFPEARYVLANYEAFNRKNDAKRLTFDDLFQKRMFDSYIIKESNVYDRRINQYKEGVDALLEAKDIKNKLFRIEHDLWSY